MSNNHFVVKILFCKILFVGKSLDAHEFWKNVPKAPGHEEFKDHYKKYTSNGDQNKLKCYFRVPKAILLYLRFEHNIGSEGVIIDVDIS